MGPMFYLNIFIREADRDHTHKRETVKAKVGMRELQAKVCWQSPAAGRGKKLAYPPEPSESMRAC